MYTDNYDCVSTYQRNYVDLKDLSLQIKQLHQRVVGGAYNLASDVPQIVKFSPEAGNERRVTGSDQRPTGVAAEWGNVSGTPGTEAELHKPLPTLSQGSEISDSLVVVLKKIADTECGRHALSNLFKSSGHLVYCRQVYMLTKDIDDTHLSCRVCPTEKATCQCFKTLSDVCNELSDMMILPLSQSEYCFRTPVRDSEVACVAVHC